MSSPGDITNMLRAIGNKQADLDQLIPMVHSQLSEIAHRALRKERDSHTLTTAALVNEAYLKLVAQDRVLWQNRNHFLAVASLVMRRVLVNYAEARLAGKRGSGAVHLSFDDIATLAGDDHALQMVEINQLLDRLVDFDPRAARVVECRYFAGMSVEETAAAMNLSAGTVKRDWVIARAWLLREMGPA